MSPVYGQSWTCNLDPAVDLREPSKFIWQNLGQKQNEVLFTVSFHKVLDLCQNLSAALSTKRS